jgi:hypothetical protein
VGTSCLDCRTWSYFQTPFKHADFDISRQEGSKVTLLDNEDKRDMQEPSMRPHLRLRNFLRQLRLQFVVLLSDISRWNANIEHPKVALYQDRIVALIHTLPHLVPLGGAILLLVLQWTEHLVGFALSENTSTTLQFVAKFHELLMQASITKALLCLVRTESVNRFVPLGALSGAMQATQLSYLCSLDFLSIFKSSVIKRWRKIMFAVAIPIFILLISLVGPSSAILMIPRPNSPSSRPSISRYALNSTETMYPTAISRANGFNL